MLTGDSSATKEFNPTQLDKNNNGLSKVELSMVFVKIIQLLNRFYAVLVTAWMQVRAANVITTKLCCKSYQIYVGQMFWEQKEGIF